MSGIEWIDCCLPMPRVGMRKNESNCFWVFSNDMLEHNWNRRWVWALWTVKSFFEASIFAQPRIVQLKYISGMEDRFEVRTPNGSIQYLAHNFIISRYIHLDFRSQRGATPPKSLNIYQPQKIPMEISKSEFYTPKWPSLFRRALAPRSNDPDPPCLAREPGPYQGDPEAG